MSGVSPGACPASPSAVKKYSRQRRTWDLATARVRWWRNDRPVHPSDSTAATDTTAIAATTALAIVTMPQASPFPSPPEPTISAAIHPRITRRQLSECDAVTITFGAPAGISHNNVGGRNSASDKYALIDKVGTFDGQHYNLKLTSALANGDDPNCKSDAEGGAEAPCSIAINSASGTVDFFIRKKEATPSPDLRCPLPLPSPSLTCHGPLRHTAFADTPGHL